MHAILLLLSLIGASEQRYTVDASLLSIARELRVADMSPEESLLGDALPTLQRTLPVVDVQINARPTGAKRFYRIQLDLAQPITVKEGGRAVLLRGLRYTATLTPDGDQTRVTSSIDLDVQLPRSHCRFVQRAIDRVGGQAVEAAERGILYRAQDTMQRLAARANSGEG
jgi:hypothetical protein